MRYACHIQRGSEGRDDSQLVKTDELRIASFASLVDVIVLWLQNGFLSLLAAV